MGLDDELVTGSEEFDLQHSKLLKEIESLRGVCRFDTVHRSCARCAESTQISCRNELHQFGRAFAQIWSTETREEERLLRRLPLNRYTSGPIETHLQGHADISEMIVTATAAAQDLEHGLHVIFDQLPTKIREHIVECDQWLVSELEKTDAD